MLTLSLATLLVPWFGWLLLQELEEFLRSGQEQALLSGARTIAASVPDNDRVRLRARRNALPLRVFESRPAVDGYASEWPEPQSALVFEAKETGSRLSVLGGRWRGRDFLFLRVEDPTPRRPEPPGAGQDGDAVDPADGVQLVLRSGRGLTAFRIESAAPGPLLISSQSEGGGQLAGHWLDTDSGYQLELALPPAGRAVDFALGAEDAWVDRNDVVRIAEMGTFQGGRPATWLTPTPRDERLGDWLDRVTPEQAQGWVVDAAGWVVADTGPRSVAGQRSPSWVERFIYWLVAGDAVERFDTATTRPLRLDTPLVRAAIAGEAGSRWAGDPETAEIRNTVAVPLFLDERAASRRTNADGTNADGANADGSGAAGTGAARTEADQVLGAVVLEANTDGALLFTNRTLGRLLGLSLLLTGALVLGLWFLATRLSRRVQSLSGAVSEAMSDAAHPRDLPMTGDRDELGELARNNARLLRAVSDYTRYLRTLAGRLSHELKTPLAITRTSLDNLSAGTLDDDARRYLERAREGLARQTAIVRAMSEASRLEAAVASADWETVDLVEVLSACAGGYRAVNPDRHIDLELPAEPVRTRCAPDLLAQALDKLVDNALGLMGAEDRLTLALVPKGDWRHVSVRNTGTRLPEELQDQLFDSLVSVREPGADLHLGLGLHIVRLVAEAHGGSVEARNLPDDGGVAFTLHLPASGKAG
jgi:signal transduction histidine kinase